MSVSREALQQLIQEMRDEAKIVRACSTAIENWEERAAGYERWADRLALLSDVLGSPRPEKDEKDQEAARVDEHTVIPPERATAASNQPVPAAKEEAAKVVNEATDLLAGISNGGNWQVWRAGSQAVNIKAKFPFAGEHCGASEVKGLPRAWSPYFCGVDVFSLPKEFNVSRFKDADADFIAAAPRLIRKLIELTASAEVVSPQTKQEIEL